MNKPNDSLQNLTSDYDFFDIDKYFQDLKNNKKLILLVTLLSFVVGMIYSLTLPNIYESNALIRPVEESMNSSTSQINKLAGIASLVGFDIGRSPASEKLSYGRKVLQSRAFTQSFTSNIEISKYLAGYKRWIKKEKKDVFDLNVFNEKTNTFIKNPSEEDLYDLLHANIIFEVDEKTNFLTLSFRHRSPTIASKILSSIISELNQVIRQQTIDDTNSALKYLQEEANKTQYLDRKKVFFNLIEQQESMKMLAFVNNEYFFSVIDEPHIPTKKIAPARLIMSIIFAMSGFAIVFLASLAKTFLRSLPD